MSPPVGAHTAGLAAGVRQAADEADPERGQVVLAFLYTLGEQRVPRAVAGVSAGAPARPVHPAARFPGRGIARPRSRRARRPGVQLAVAGAGRIRRPHPGAAAVGGDRGGRAPSGRQSKEKAALARDEPVTDRLGEVASFFGGRAQRDQVTRHVCPARLPDEDLAQLPAGRLMPPGKAERFGEVPRDSLRGYGG